MMIYLELFLTFLQIGAVSFGGGYAMIPLVRERVLAHGWLNEEEILNIIAISESTPGPIAVNMATFVGSTQGGILGSALATLGVILPSFIIILLISAVIKNFLKYKPVEAFLVGLRPAIVALILATAATLMLNTLFGVDNVYSVDKPDLFGIIIFAILLLSAAVYKHFKKKKPSPIVMIIFSACLGMLFYGLR